MKIAPSFRVFCVASLCLVMFISTPCGLTNRARAVTVGKGKSQFLRGTNKSSRPVLEGRVLEDRTQTFGFSDSMESMVFWTLSGTVEERIVRRKGSKTLDFYFCIKNDASSTLDIVLVQRFGFDRFPAVDVDYRNDKSGKVGASSVRFVPTLPHAWSFFPDSDQQRHVPVTFDFSRAPIKPGQQSRFHFVGTTATSYDAKGFMGFSAIKPPESTKIILCGPIVVFEPH